MSLSARLTFSQIGIAISIIAYLVVRGFFVLLTGGLLWTQPGSILSIALPLGPVIVLGFTACAGSYGYSYLGLWLIDHEKGIIGVITTVFGVIIVPAALAAYSWFFFPAV